MASLTRVPTSPPGSIIYQKGSQTLEQSTYLFIIKDTSEEAPDLGHV